MSNQQLKAGLYGNVIRVLGPITIENALLDKALGILPACFRHLLGKDGVNDQ